jgi:hypothetical protein
VGRNPPKNLQKKSSDEKLKVEVAKELKKSNPDLSVSQALNIANQAVEEQKAVAEEAMAQQVHSVPEEVEIVNALKAIADKTGVVPTQGEAMVVAEQIKKNRAKYITQARIDAFSDMDAEKVRRADAFRERQLQKRVAQVGESLFKGDIAKSVRRNTALKEIARQNLALAGFSPSNVQSAMVNPLSGQLYSSSLPNYPAPALPSYSEE